MVSSSPLPSCYGSAGRCYRPRSVPFSSHKISLRYRLHLFGYVVAMMAFIALATLVAGSAGRIIVWPAVGVLGAGLILVAIAAAFYYHFGAWGSKDMEGKDNATIQGFIDSLRVSTEYVTCLTRFGRVFLGVGQIVLMVGLLVPDAMWPTWLVGAGGILGLIGMGLTMGLPDDLSLYHPVFQLNSLWLAAMGVATLTLA